MSEPQGNGRPRRRVEVVHRGVRWRRSVGGTVTWLNDGLGRWVTWYPGSDAPPLPPGWELEAGEVRPPASARERAPVSGGTRVRSGTGASAAGVGGQDDAGVGGRDRANGQEVPVERRAMRSPYRLLPVLIAIAVVALAVWQATRPPVTATPADVAAAKALKGECLSRSGGTASSPRFSPSPLSCSDKSAAVKVVAVVVPGSKRGPNKCPRGAGVVQVLQPGIKDEPVECTEPIRHSS